MVRREDLPRLDVREAFEPTRLSPQCLIRAYARVVPVRRAGLPKGECEEEAGRPARREGGKHA
jgi:hypothetical protein